MALGLAAAGETIKIGVLPGIYADSVEAAVDVAKAQLARVAGDVDLAFGYPHYIVATHAFDPSSGLLYSGTDDEQFAILFAARLGLQPGDEVFVAGYCEHVFADYVI
jgi:hypothetical protein